MNCVCPKCNSDQIQRFSIAYEGGVSDSTSRSTGIGVGMARGGLGVGLGGSSTRSVSVSRLAQRVAPPAQQSGPSFFWLLPCFILWCIPHIGTVLVILVFGVFAYFRGQKMKWNKTEWPRLMQEWESTWLCHKCGNEFKLA